MMVQKEPRLLDILTLRKTSIWIRTTLATL